MIRRSTIQPVEPPSAAARLAQEAAALGRRGIAACTRHPTLTGGLTSFGVLAAFVWMNALLAQPGPHPEPLLATREGGDRLGAQSPSVGNNTALMAVPLVREVQVALAQTGHYQATVDGKPGRATEGAIRAFQAEHGLPIDGMSSPTLLARIRELTAAAPAPEPLAGEDARYASLDERMGADTTGSVTATDETGPRLQVPSEPLDQTELVRLIQSGLDRAQVAELTADGIAGEQTRAAIRTFEALEGLDITGEPDQRILDRLIAIGVVQ